MNDTTRRFLDAVLERVPESRIVEVRLFPAIRQGGIESGIAVLAVNPEPPLAFPDAAEPVDLESESLFESGTEGQRSDETLVDLIAIDDVRANEDPFREEEDEPGSRAGHPEVDDDTSATVIPARRASASAAPESSVGFRNVHDDRTTEFEVGLEGIADAPTQEIPAVHEEATAEVPVDLAAATADAGGAADGEDDIALGDILSLPARPIPAGPDRLAILCARYKLIVKGPDRGKWDIEIVHQADAPIDTLDLVIKGVVRRSGDDAVPERFTRQSLRDLLDAPAWATDV